MVKVTKKQIVIVLEMAKLDKDTFILFECITNYMITPAFIGLFR